ncbi:MAG: hypothetical protein AAGA48_25575 [Myxococcota bacterium]
MRESVPSRADAGAPAPLPVREIALLTLAMMVVGTVCFGLGYVTGRDQVAYVHRPNAAQGIDATLADDALVDLLARIEVSNAADNGLSELRFPDELRGRPQDRPASGRVLYAIDLGRAPQPRIDDLQVVLRGRGVHADVVRDGGEPRLLVGVFTDPSEAASWLPLLEEGLSGLGLEAPKVVADPR